jgi:hypothetical protein
MVEYQIDDVTRLFNSGNGLGAVAIVLGCLASLSWRSARSPIMPVSSDPLLGENVSIRIGDENWFDLSTKWAGATSRCSSNLYPASVWPSLWTVFKLSRRYLLHRYIVKLPCGKQPVVDPGDNFAG